MTSIKNTFKTNWKLIVVVASAAFVLGLLIQPSSENQTTVSAHKVEATTWTCSMHPQIRQPEPGKCPICAMDLIPVVEEAGAADLGERQLRLSPAAQKLAHVQTSRVERKAISKSISLYGKIAIDETRQKTITAWAPGRIEKLFVNFTGAPVQRDEVLAEIYSPELFVAQQEYLNALRDSSALLSIQPVQKKFELWGITSEQLAEIEQRGTATERMSITSPVSGIVLQKAVLPGEYVKTGEKLYEIADLGRVWIYLDVYEQDLPWLREGQNITFLVQALPGQTFSGTIDFIDPVLDPSSRTVKVRAVAENPENQLKPGLLVSAHVSTTLKNELAVPASAVLLTGERAVVYIAVPDQDGVFEGRDITVGERSGDYFVVQDGLKAGDEVVTNGAFKIDSEMQILAKPSMMSSDRNVSEQNDAEMNMSQHRTEQPSETTPVHDHQSAEAKQHNSQVSTQFVESLDAVYLAYFDIEDQLARDKTENLEAASDALSRGLDNVKADQAGQYTSQWRDLAKQIQRSAELIATDNISIARAEFKKLSDALIQTAILFGASEHLSVKQYHCPMAFNDTGADWLSPKDEVENPYFGAEMFSCGWRVKTFSDGQGGDK